MDFLLKRPLISIFFSSVLIFFGSWVVSYNIGVNDLIIQSEDTVPSLLLPVAVIKDKTLFLDNYYDFMLDRYPQPDDKSYEKGLVPFYLRKVTDPQTGEIHVVSAFPLVSGLLGVPVFTVPLLLGLPITWENLAILGHLTSSITMALAGIFMFKVLSLLGVVPKKALLLTFIYLFGTINYSLLSQAMWQHGVVQLFTLIGLYFLLSVFEKAQITDSDTTSLGWVNFFWAGFFLMLAILTRPTALLVFVFMLVFIFTKVSQRIKPFIVYSFWYFMGLIPGVLFFIWYNSTYYFSIFNQGYADQAGSGWLGRFPEGFLGLLLSPSKGLLVYSPVFIFSLVGIFIVLRRRRYKADAFYLLAFTIFILHFLVLGKWKHWYGGWSYGYRMGSDVLPFLILLLVPYVESNLFKKTAKLFIVSVVFSVLVQIHGIIFFDGIWHAAYDGGFQNTEWLWSIKDSEFAFNIRRVLVKLGILTAACPNCLPS